MTAMTPAELDALDPCPHRVVVTWKDPDGDVALWACSECQRRFHPACTTCVDVGHRNVDHLAAARSGLDVERLRRIEALARDCALAPCYCDAVWLSRGRHSPDCFYDFVGDDLRAALSETPK